MRIVHEKIRYGCDRCEFSTSQPYNLKRHQQIKHEGVNVEFSCGICEFTASTSSLVVYFSSSRCETAGDEFDCLTS